MANTNLVWVIDDDKSIRWVLERALKKASINVKCFKQAQTLLESLEHSLPDAVITDIRMPEMDGLTLLERIKTQHPDLPVVVMTAHSDLESAVSSFHAGAFEYLPKPFDLADAVDIARRACTHSQRNRNKVERTTESQSIQEETPEIIGEAPAMQEVFRAIGRLVRSHITVLINGESGTGKELVARALHKHSPRQDGPFVALNMAAIPHDLLESELFGHERGAFTGAQNRRTGRFEQADGGTLFLDEIGDMTPALQTRLLRVLAEGEFFPVGGHSAIKSDVRVITATHQNLEARVAQGQFREDLFHRLNVIRVHIPPLRKRRQDIPLLLKHFLSRAGSELGVETKNLQPNVETFLCQLDWPGNVRQLENICRWLTVMASGQDVHIEDLPPELIHSPTSTTDPDNLDTEWQNNLRHWVEKKLLSGDLSIAKNTIPSVETIMIESALHFTGGHRQEAARLLGYGRNTLTRKIKELDLRL